jgi:excisionase family DNA binding protein
MQMERKGRSMSLEQSPTKLAYGISEVVEATNVGRSRLYEDIRAGKLKTFKVGKRTLIAADDLKKWLESYREAAG